MSPQSIAVAIVSAGLIFSGLVSVSHTVAPVIASMEASR